MKWKHEMIRPDCVGESLQSVVPPAADSVWAGFSASEVFFFLFVLHFFGCRASGRRSVRLLPSSSWPRCSDGSQSGSDSSISYAGLPENTQRFHLRDFNNTSFLISSHSVQLFPGCSRLLVKNYWVILYPQLRSDMTQLTLRNKTHLHLQDQKSFCSIILK